jgi:hypothetical protein
MTPNNAIGRGAKRRYRLVPTALRAPAPGHCERYATN